ncbi:hypothetical protein EVAR_62827_1 [Eumeta japonica]|uniref:Uncharacterized protein n=1 Tax=Eumeta variegata TaxID=151549 RepID=A0A4C2A453_EUMVA|nr:hypothetical protein EVAR_62827_1 [Eumeta japonica]
MLILKYLVGFLFYGRLPPDTKDVALGATVYHARFIRYHPFYGLHLKNTARLQPRERLGNVICYWSVHLRPLGPREETNKLIDTRAQGSAFVAQYAARVRVYAVAPPEGVVVAGSDVSPRRVCVTEDTRAASVPVMLIIEYRCTPFPLDNAREHHGRARPRSCRFPPAASSAWTYVHEDTPLSFIFMDLGVSRNPRAVLSFDGATPTCGHGQALDCNLPSLALGSISISIPIPPLHRAPRPDFNFRTAIDHYFNLIATDQNKSPPWSPTIYDAAPAATDVVGPRCLPARKSISCLYFIQNEGRLRTTHAWSLRCADSTVMSFSLSNVAKHVRVGTRMLMYVHYLKTVSHRPPPLSQFVTGKLRLSETVRAARAAVGVCVGRRASGKLLLCHKDATTRAASADDTPGDHLRVTSIDGRLAAGT